MSLEEASNETAAIKDEITIIQREISENYEEDLMNIYNELQKNPGNKRAILHIKTPFGFSLKVETTIRCGL
jgi:DNA polymerase-3 subunit alpha